MYYREFGIPARIGRANTTEEIEHLVKRWNGVKNCYVSVYTFDANKDIDGKTTYDSAMLNTIWFDFDDDNDVDKCLKDIRKFINKYCIPNKITPRIYLTGGKGFQMNIDFQSPIDFPDSIKRKVLKEYLLHLKKKYKLSTLDERCINNSVSCLRRIPNTQYISKATGQVTGVWCTQFSVQEIMNYDVTELYERAMKNTGTWIAPIKSKRAQRDMIDFSCDIYDIKHTISNSSAHLLDKINKATGSITHATYTPKGFIKPIRGCVMELIKHNIAKGRSNHDQNNVIAAELINAGWTDTDISFVFSSIYNEPAGNYGWYDDDPNKAGWQIIAMRRKEMQRYSIRKVKEIGGGCSEYCPCEAS